DYLIDGREAERQQHRAGHPAAEAERRARRCGTDAAVTGGLGQRGQEREAKGGHLHVEERQLREEERGDRWSHQHERGHGGERPEAVPVAISRFARPWCSRPLSPARYTVRAVS